MHDEHETAAAEAAAYTQYKVVEIATVTEETLEAVLNEWTAKGWHLESIQFAMREASRRPSMAFVLFKR